MDESMKKLVGHNMAKDSTNLKIQKLGSDDELGTGGSKNRWPGWPGDNVFRILVPSQKVGSIIGRKGEIIKTICEETKARIKILDGPPGAPERAVIISAKEEPDALISPAMECLFRVHKYIVNGIDGEFAQAPPNSGQQLPTRLLVTATQTGFLIGFLIGKQGATIKSFQEVSKAVVRVVGELPPVALQDDKVAEILGEPEAMHKALELVVNYLRKFLVDRSVLPLFEINMLMRQPQMEQPVRNPHMEQHMYPHVEHHMHHPYREQHMAPTQTWGPLASLPNTRGPGYGTNHQFMPAMPHDNFYPPPDYFVEKPTHCDKFPYGREPLPMGGHPSLNQPTKISYHATHHMQIPISYADAVIGSAGANVSYVRRTSGATVCIQKSDNSGEMTVEIIGSATQVQTAQQLIKATHHMQIPLSYADAVIGSTGANTSYIRRTSGATVSIQESDTSGEMTVEIIGSTTQVQTAQQLINNSIAAASVRVQNQMTPTSGPAQDEMQNSIAAASVPAQNQMHPAQNQMQMRNFTTTASVPVQNQMPPTSGPAPNQMPPTSGPAPNQMPPIV